MESKRLGLSNKSLFVVPNHIIEQFASEFLQLYPSAIEDAKRDRAENFTVKQMEKTRKSLEAKIEKLNKQERKDDVVNFEQLGVDKLFVDEAHNYKNCARRCYIR